MSTTKPAATPAIEARELLDNLVSTARTMILRRTIEVKLLNSAVDAVEPARMMRRDWESPDLPDTVALVAHHLKRIVETLGGSAVSR